MKSRLEPVNVFAYRVMEGGELIFGCCRLRKAIRERDRQWERMLATLYREREKRRR